MSKVGASKLTEWMGRGGAGGVTGMPRRHQQEVKGGENKGVAGNSKEAIAFLPAARQTIDSSAASISSLLHYMGDPEPWSRHLNPNRTTCV